MDRNRKIEKSGTRYNNLVVLGPSDKIEKSRGLNWLCRCDCGREVHVRGYCLRGGKAKSCGCVRNAELSEKRRTHGLTKTPEYRAWHHMKERCGNPNDKRFDDYGGRGIIVCDQWKGSFEKFIQDMGLRPSNKHSLDRFPDINGNYEPSNCRWATLGQQSTGLRCNVWVEYNGEKMIISELGRRLGKKNNSNIRKKLLSGKTIPGVILLGKINENRQHKL